MPEPVSLLTAGASALGVGGAVTSAIAPYLPSFILAAGTTLAGLFLKPEPPKPDSGKVSIQQTTPAQIFAVGTNRLAGATVLFESRKRVLYHVTALCAHRIDEITGYYLGDDRVTLTGDVVDGQTDGRYGHQKVQIQTRLGVIPETNYSDITTELGSGLWPSDARGDRTASMFVRAKAGKPDVHGEIFPYGRPIGSVIANCARVYDPREAGQDPDVPGTWTFSKNVALQILWWKCFARHGFRQDYATAVLPIVDEWKLAADICDESVDLKGGGSQPRYHGGTWGTTENDKKAFLARLLMACDGWIVDRPDGTCLLRVGQFHDSGVVITDDEIIGFDLNRGGKPDEEAVNRLAPTYTSPDHDFSTVAVDAVEDAADQAARGQIRDMPYPLEAVQSFQAARRIAKREMQRQKEKLSGTLDLKLSGINAGYERFVKIESASIPCLADKWIEIRGGTISLQSMRLRLEFVGSGDYIDDYDEDDDEGEAPPIPDPPAQEGAYIPTTLLVVPELKQSSSGNSGVVLDISFDDPQDDDLNYEVRWRDIGSGSGVEWVTQVFTTALVSGGSVFLTTGFVPAETELEVEVRSIGSKGTGGPWSSTITVDTTVTNTAPSSPVNLTSALVSGTPQVEWNLPSSTNVVRSKLYRAATGAGFGLAILVSIRNGGPNQHRSFHDVTVPTGATYDYYVTAENAAGDASSPTGPETIAVP